MVVFAFFFAAGVWLLQQQAALPVMHWAWLLAVPVLLLPLARRLPRPALVRSVLYAILACLLGFFHASWYAQQRLADKLAPEWQGRTITVVGTVAELPRLRERGLSVAFDVEQVLTPGVHVPQHILLSAYPDKQNTLLPLHAGERWRLAVRLKQPHGTANPHGFDFEQWMLERDLRASGYVRDDTGNQRLDVLVKKPQYLIERLREAVRDRIAHALPDAPYAGVLVALAVGDQASISQSQWTVFTRTGVNHLMSISGLHITMVGSVAFFITYFLWRRSHRLGLKLPARKAASIAGLALALLYALISGFSVPAQRTVCMLATFAAALLSSRNISPSQMLAAALIVVLLFDPWSVLAPGFWLSFGAVALIFYVTANRLGRVHWLAEYGRVQWAMTIGLIPPMLALFQQVSLVSPIANAVAIPLVSFLIVPLTLIGAVLSQAWLLQLAHIAMSVCMLVLDWLNQLPAAVWQQSAPPAWSVLLGAIGSLWLLLPRGFPVRWLGLILILPMFLIPPETPATGSLRLTVLDVGQGLAVIAQTHNHALLYDAGPDYAGESDSGSRVVVPVLRAQGIARLDTLILSHDDIDHIGGARSVLQAIPVSVVLSSLPQQHPLLQDLHNSMRCMDGENWEWDGVQFEMLHPTRASYAQDISDNNRGCVLRISVGVNSILLAADIEKESEQRLLKVHPGLLPATLLVVPHHGSLTSSSMEFVQAVHPRYAVFTAGYRNRFHHPREKVVARYRKLDSELLRSGQDGAITVTMDAAQFEVQSYRRSHARYWDSTGQDDDTEVSAAAP